MNHYVYIYLRKDRPGRYTYGPVTFLYEPFYVGKGTRTRYKPADHLYSNNTNLVLKRLIRKLGEDLVYFMIETKLSDAEAIEKEKHYISLIGRKDLAKGPLINRTIGGEGTKGIIQSKEWIEKRLKAKAWYQHTEETKNKISNTLKGRKPPEEVKMKLRGRKHSKETKEKMHLSRMGHLKNKIPIDEISNIIQRSNSGESYASIAKDYNVTGISISNAIKNRINKNQRKNDES